MVSPHLDEVLPVNPGHTRLNDRYQVIRKLGTGVFSETWLVEDERREYVVGFSTDVLDLTILRFGKYHAAKILTLDATQRHGTGEMQELQFLRKIAEHSDDVENLPILEDDFIVHGPRGDHLCFIMIPLCSDVSSFRRSSPTKALPVYFVKNIISLVLEGLDYLHGLDIVHTDVKLDNLLFSGIGDKQVEERIGEPLAVEGEYEVDGITYPLCRPQPLPHGFTWKDSPHEAERILVTLTDLGQAQCAGQTPTVDEFSAPSLRAPELILRSSFGPKIDIWAVGCITFELLTGHWLFNPVDGEPEWTIEDDHLAKMMELTGECFTPETLKYAQRREEFFDDNGRLLRIDQLIPVSLEAALSNYKLLDPADVDSAAAFIRSCLCLDPFQRPTARELMLSPWLRDAFYC
ncbi:unnamed protein product [Somion occarium]|uniref:non-specific serine/threonine protein kinase n=2 Tax=Somion occarium TaxID=3059160 RepID=A0ABP1DDH8_9APHY